MKKAYLVLADGTVFEGDSFGASAEALGELTFITSVVGYLETLSDPGNTGRIVVQTFPQIGNYGTVEADLISGCRPAGYVVRQWCASPSNFRCEGEIDAFLKRENIPGICGIDTRALTRHIRENGVMNAAIVENIPADLSSIRMHQSENPLSRIGRREWESVSPTARPRVKSSKSVDIFSPRSQALTFSRSRQCLSRRKS